MPNRLKQLDREFYCSAPPLSTSSLRLPRLSREVEARCPRAPIVEMKREVTSSIESAEFVQDKDFDVKPALKIEVDPRQLRVGLAALAIRPTSPSSSGDAAVAASAPGPSQWGVRSAALCQIPEGDLGPADPPGKRGRPKGSKTRPQVAFNLHTLPERAEKLKAEERLAGMKSSRQV